jgi:hypothetical protein
MELFDEKTKGRKSRDRKVTTKQEDTMKEKQKDDSTKQRKRQIKRRTKKGKQILFTVGEQRAKC